MEFLKELLGEELYKQVAEKLGDKVKLADLKTGNYVGKDKFEAAEQAKKQLEDTIKQRDKDLEALKKSAEGNAELQKQLEDLKSTYSAETEKRKSEAESYQAKLKDMEISTALKLALTGKVHDVDLVSGLLKRDKIELGEDGSIKSGIKEQIEDLQKNKSFLFVQEQIPKLGGIKPADGVPPQQQPKTGFNFQFQTVRPMPEAKQ